MTPVIALWIRRLGHPTTMKRTIGSFFRGLVKFIKWYRGWVSAVDKAHLYAQNATPRDRASHDNWCLLRRRISWVTLGIIVAGLGVATKKVGPIAPGAFSLAVAGALVFWGRPAGTSVVVEKEVVPHRPVVDGDTLRQIVASATTGIKAEDWRTIRVLGQGLTWDSDRVWWTIRLELPGTLPGTAVVKAFPGLMSGLAVGRSQLLVKVDPENEGIVTISGTEIDPWSKPPQQTPLMREETFNIFDPIPAATDARGHTIYVSLLFTGWLIGAIPRMGKTNLARLLMLAAALDVNTDLSVWDLKGGGDWRMFEPMCLESGFGHSNDVISRLLKFLETVQEEVDRRSELISTLPVEECPEGQLTRELAMDPDLDMRPILILIDDFHWAFQHPILGRKIANEVEGLIKSGQYVGVWFILATQRPDTKSIPGTIRDCIGTRAAGKCMTRQSSETVLGTEAVKEGFNAASLPRKAGVVIIYGADDTAGLVEAGAFRSHRCDTPAATMVAERATNARAKVGRLPQQRQPREEPVLLQRARQIQGEREFVSSAELLEQVNGLPEFADQPFNHTTLGRALRDLQHPSQQRKEIGGRMGFDVRKPRPRNVLRREAEDD